MGEGGKENKEGRKGEGEIGGRTESGEMDKNLEKEREEKREGRGKKKDL